MEGGRLEGNRCYKIFILYLLFMDNLKDLCEPKLVRPETNGSQCHLEYFQKMV